MNWKNKNQLILFSFLILFIIFSVQSKSSNNEQADTDPRFDLMTFSYR